MPAAVHGLTVVAGIESSAALDPRDRAPHRASRGLRGLRLGMLPNCDVPPEPAEWPSRPTVR